MTLAWWCERLPGRIWVRLRGRVKSVPLEKIRLATNEELVSGQFINEALNELHEELSSGQLRATEVDTLQAEEEMPQVAPELQAIPEDSSSVEACIAVGGSKLLESFSKRRCFLKKGMA